MLVCVPLDEFVVVHGAAQLQHAPRHTDTDKTGMQSQKE